MSEKVNAIERRRSVDTENFKGCAEATKKVRGRGQCLLDTARFFQSAS